MSEPPAARHPDEDVFPIGLGVWLSQQNDGVRQSLEIPLPAPLVRLGHRQQLARLKLLPLSRQETDPERHDLAVVVELLRA